MPHFRNMPIKRKLMVIIMVTTTAALMLAGAGIVIVDSILFRGYLERDLTALAEIVAENSTAALAFEDPRAASETLGALRARTHIVSACIFRGDGTVLARYSRPDVPPECPPLVRQTEMEFTPTHLNVARRIVLNQRQLGTLVVLYDLGEIGERAMLYGTTVFGVLLASTLAAFLLSSRLRHLIATPISQLAGATALVSKTKDYSIRAQKTSGDELGVLVDAFNEMLEGIQVRDNELKKALLAQAEALGEAERARHSLQTTLTSIGDAVISTDVQGRVVFANPVALSLLRCGQEELAGRKLDDVFNIVNEFTRVKVESPVAKVLREGSIVGLANHTILIAQDGTEVPIDDSGAPIRGESGAIQGTVLVFRDVTERRRAEENRRLLASIVESSGDAIIGTDLDGVVTTWNQAAAYMFGYAAEEMIGRSISTLAGDHSDETRRTLESVKSGQRVGPYESVRRTSCGELINVSLTISPLYGAHEQIIGASKIARDITEQVRAAHRLSKLNADLQQTNERLARSNSDLERFAFVASHDLQEPLRMITAYSQLLVKTYPGTLDDKAAMCVDNIVSGTKRMRELLADLLAYAEIGAPPEEPLEPLDLNSVVEDVRQNLKVSIEESGAVITSDDLPTLRAYKGHFLPLFQNLVGNAIKYRSDRPPRVHISVQESNGQFRFAVADNGIGIDAEYHDRIFVAFKRLHGKKIPGTGIGLAICQRVVERYGGRIWVDSKPGQGSTFFFALPGSSRSNEERP